MIEKSPLAYRDQLTDRLFRQRTLLLTGEVNDEMAERVCAELVLLATADADRDVVLYINSPGGSMLAGLAIYDTMRLIPNDVGTVAMGLRRQHGPVPALRGHARQAIRLPHSRIMMHQPSAGIGGTAMDMQIQARATGVHQAL